MSRSADHRFLTGIRGIDRLLNLGSPKTRYLGSLLHGFSGQCQGVGAMCVTWGLYFMGSLASVRELVSCV